MTRNERIKALVDAQGQVWRWLERAKNMNLYPDLIIAKKERVFQNITDELRELLNTKEE